MSSVTPLHPGPVPAEPLRFGPWLLDRRSGELRRGDHLVRLQEQPARVLELLVLRTGEVVTREELIAHVWPRGVVIDFDTGLNTAIRKLRVVLEDDAEQPRYIETLPRRGYRMLRQPEPPAGEVGAAPESRETASPPPAPMATSASTPPPSSPHHTVRRWVAAGVLAVIAAAALLLLWRPGGVGAVQDSPTSGGARPAAPAAEALPRDTIAVLPFRRLGSAAADETLALGIAESVLHQLSASPELRVIARTSAFAFREPAQDPAAVGRALGARYLLDGTVQTEGDRLRLTTRLTDAQTGRTAWSLRFDRRIADVFALQDEIAAQVARILRVSLAGSGPQVTESQGTADVDAYFEFLQGRSLTASRRVQDLRRAERLLLAATARDAQFAAAWAQLARTRELLMTYDPADAVEDKKARWQEALATARRALELAPDSPAALVAMGSLTEDPQAGLDYLRRATMLNPNYALAWQQIAEALVSRGVPHSEALPAIDAALKLDPLEPRLHYLKGLHHYMVRGDMEAAARQLQATLAVSPDYYVALARLAQVNGCCLGRQAEAVRLAEQALRLDPQARWVRRLLVALYLDLDEPDAAAQVAAQAPVPEPGSLLLLDLFAGRVDAALARLLDPRNSMLWSYYETDESSWLGRLPLLRPGDAAGLRRAFESADERVLSMAQPQHQGEEELAARVARAALLLGQGRREEAGVDLARALEMTAPADDGNGLGRRLAESRVVALALAGRHDEALALLESSTRAGPWSNWWYYARLEPAFAPLRADPRFAAWERRMRAHVDAERGRLQGLRAAGQVPRRTGNATSRG